MSMMLKERPRTTRPSPAAEPVETAKSKVERYPIDPKAVRADLEFPEEAIREDEGPEMWKEWHSEAPDAGQGETRSIEREFTHGRSRS